MQTNRTYLLNPELTTAQLADAIMQRCNQLQALIGLCHCEDFLDYAEEYIHNFFWLQSSIITELKELFVAYSKA